MTDEAGWFWRFNMGGSGHYVPRAEPGEYGLWVARQASPCGQASVGITLENPTRHGVFFETSCYVCRKYATRHGIPLPASMRVAVCSRLDELVEGVTGEELLRRIEAEGLYVAVKAE